ncbi:hypothetical protein L3i20_v244340 [Paenibacillus sp. L3-i20]|nr:hypothetical protein L3i20_v244340 [Paenibacillus sp. L3-i20]
MSFLTIIAVLILGIVMFSIGFATKKKWIKLLSIIPLAISLWQIAILFSIGYG